jgi:asparagine synthetase B (glutamine-hydrolysing)
LALEGEVATQSGNARRIVSLYERHGRDLFDHLEGAYLAAVLDVRTGLFIVGHDGMGRHPLYYAKRPGELWFASNIFALAEHAPISRASNRLSLALRLLGRWPEAGQTFFNDIQRVRPGHFLDVTSRGEVREVMHWHPVPDDQEPWLPDAEAREGFEPMLQKAVNRCLSLGARGVMLSGGIDSVSVAALACREAKNRGLQPLIAYTARNPPGYPRDHEEDAQDRVVQSLRMPHRVSTMTDWLGPRSLLSTTLEKVPALPGPTDIWWTGAYMGFYGTPATEGVRTLLTGSGGDEWLGVNRSHAADLLRRMDVRGLLGFVRATVETEGYELGAALRQILWKNALRSLIGGLWMKVAPAHKEAYHRRRRAKLVPGWLCPDPRLGEELADAINVHVPELDDTKRFPLNYYRHTFRFLWGNPLITYEFERQFHVTRLLGIRLLAPFHDREFVRYANRISPRAHLHTNRYKGLLRSLTERRLPGLGLGNQRKSGYTAKEDTTLEDLRENLGPVSDQVGCKRLAELGIVDEQKLVQEPMLASHQALVRRFIVLSCEKWVGAHCGASARPKNKWEPSEDENRN